MNNRRLRLLFQLKVLLLLLAGLMGLSTLVAQACVNAGRYVDPIFEETEIQLSEERFVVFDSTDLWLNGDSSNCFTTTNYLSPTTDGQFEMYLDVYQPDPSLDGCTQRPAILFMHGGGYAHIAGNKRGGNPTDMALEVARRGYVVFVIDYRKGWDIREAQAQNSNPNFPTPLLPGCQNCPCDGPDCDDFSFVLATYKMAQDVIAAHKYLVANQAGFGIDPTQIHYWGSSTGAVGVAHAAYGGAAFASLEDSNGNSLEELAGTLDAYGPLPAQGWPQKPASVHLLAGAIKDFNFIDAEDDVPIFFSHGSRDESVPYCQGRILSMRYTEVPDPFANLGLYGPGTMYQRFVELNDPETRAHLYTYNGLFHSFTPLVGSNNLNLNCLELRSLESFLQPAFEFTKARFEGMALQNEHHRTTNANNLLATCNVIRQDEDTQCNPILSAQEATLEELDLRLFPNPARAQATISWAGDHTISAAEISLYDLSGRVYPLEIGTSQSYQRAIDLDLTKLPSGAYYLRIGALSRFLIVY